MLFVLPLAPLIADVLAFIVQVAVLAQNRFDNERAAPDFLLRLKVLI